MFEMPYPPRCFSLKQRLGARFRPLLLASAIGCVLAEIPSVQAQQETTAEQQRNWNIPAQSLSAALVNWSQVSGVQLFADTELTRGLRSTAVQGRHSAVEALERLLSGTGLTAHFLAPDRVTLIRTESAKGNMELDVLSVVGENEGYASDLPEVYAGGQVARGAKLGMLGNQDIFDTPFSVTSYTAELIENQQARTVADVILNDASVHLTNPSQGSGEAFSIRGFSTGGGGSELYAGLPGLTHRRRSTIETMERVEVFKGPNALLTGTVGTVGGVINLEPKKPLATPLTRFTTTYEAESKIGMHTDVSRRFGPNDQFGVRFNGIYHDGESAFENNREELKELSFALDSRTENLRLTTVLDYSGQHMKGGNQLFTVTEVPSAPDTSDAIQQPWEKLDSSFKRALLQAEYDLNDNWMLSAAWGITDYEGYWLRTTGSGLDRSGNYTQRAQQQSDEQDSRTGRAGIRGYFNTGPISHQLFIDTMRTSTEYGRLSATVSGYSVSSNINNPVMTSRPSYSSITLSPDKTSRSITNSTAIADTLGFFEDQVLLTVGFRHQRIRTKNYSSTTGATTSEYDESTTTPAYALVVKPTHYLSLYGNYIEALESGPTAPSYADNAGEIFPPSETRQVEFGAKFDFDDFGLTIGFFQIKRPSEMLDANNRYSVSGEQRNRGLEISGFGEIISGVRLLGGITYIKSKLTKTASGQYGGNEAVGVPRRSGVLGVEWDTPFVDSLTLSGRVNYTDRQYILDDNSQSIPSYTVYSAGARYKTKIGGQELTVRANVDNLFDKDYWTTFTGSSGILYLGTPRQMKVSMTLDW